MAASDGVTEGEALNSTDFTVETDELRRGEYRFLLSPTLWDQYRGPDDLEWHCVSFRRDDLGIIPDDPGVYAFCVQPSIGGNLCGSYLLYVGKTARGLRTRCGEYLRKAKGGNARRPRMREMLRLFAGTDYLRFCFAIVSEADPAKIEASLLEATVPPNCRKLPGSVQPAVDAFR